MSQSYFYHKQLLNALEYIGLVVLLFYRKNLYSIVAYTIIGLSIIIFSERKHFPYLSYLYVTPASIERRFCCFTSVHLSREGMYYSSCRIRSVDFAVFSSENIEYCSLTGIFHLVRTKRAILYPFTERLKIDLAAEFGYDSKLLEDNNQETFDDFDD